MEAANDLLRAIGEGIVGLVGGALRALEAAVQGVFGFLQSLLPGLWLPVIAVVVVLVVGWNLAKR